MGNIVKLLLGRSLQKRLMRGRFSPGTGLRSRGLLGSGGGLLGLALTIWQVRRYFRAAQQRRLGSV